MTAQNLLLQMIYHSKMLQEKNFKKICSIATNVLGLPKGSLAFKNRSKNIQSARASVCYIAFTEENIERIKNFIKNLNCVLLKEEEN